MRGPGCAARRRASTGNEAMPRTAVAMLRKIGPNPWHHLEALPASGRGHERQFGPPKPTSRPAEDADLAQ